MQRGKRIAIVVAIIVALVAIAFAIGIKGTEFRNRRMAVELVELHRQWDTNTNIPGLFESLTNLPFHKGGVGVGNGSVARRYNLLGLKCEQSYFVYQPTSATNAVDWTLYHAWYWYWPRGGRKTLVMRQLVTIKEET